MRIVLTILMLFLLTLSAEAQGMRSKKRHSDATTQSDEQKKQRAAADKAYKSTLTQLPDKKFDPWAKVR